MLIAGSRDYGVIELNEKEMQVTCNRIGGGTIM
jgi:hypothetical protein